MNDKTLILVRHAHRDKNAGREKDNGLSRKGRAQAERVTQHFRRVHAGANPLILSSPKRRCLETVAPLATAQGGKVEVSPLLDEQSESDRAFQLRLDKFCRWWRKEGPELTIACSHGDWIPLCLQKITGVSADLKKGGWAEISVEQGEPKLKWLLQELNYP